MTEAKVKREPIPTEVLETIYEEWVGYPDKRQRVPIKEHVGMTFVRGWWFSGWRGQGEEMQPLPDDIATRLGERENGL